MKNTDSEIRIVNKIKTLMTAKDDIIKMDKIEEKNDNIIENNLIEDNDLIIGDNIDINFEKSKSSYKSMFSIISIKENEEGFENEKNLEPLENGKEDTSCKRADSIISQISRESTNNNNTISFWEAVKLKFNDIKNHIVFNYNFFSYPNNIVNINQKLANEIQIFDEKYINQEDLLNKLKNIPWFSYRENFEQITDNENNKYTSDAGWGCMLRTSQMILAQGLCKLNNINTLYDFINQFFAYFYDNKIPIKFMCKQKKKEIKEKINSKEENKSFNDFEIIDKDNEFNISFINLTSEIIKGLENMSERKSDKEYIIPPYSIRNFIKVQKHINKNGKQIGEWFSNYDAIRLISTINKRMNSYKDCDFKVFNFNEGIAYIEEIINNCFEEYIEKDNKSNEFEILSLSSLECQDICNYNLENNKYIFNNKKYIFRHKFILFISVRHGLYTLEEDYYNEVLKIFDIDCNIGIIGGKNTRAFYFIGKCGNNLIFLDPHYVQQTLSLKKIGTDVVQETYIPNDIFYMPVNELSPSFTIGFAVNDMKNFKKLIKSFKSKDFFVNNENGIKKNINSIFLFEVKNFNNSIHKES